MRTLFSRLTRVSLALSALIVVGLLASPAGATGPSSGVVFDSIPSTLPGNIPSVGFEATSAAEFGDYSTFSTTNPNHLLQNVDVVMSSWGCESGHWFDGTCTTTPGATFSHPITFTIYANDLGSPGATLATVTQTFAIPFRPSADPVCSGGGWHSATDNACYSGFATTITFDFSGQNLTLPASVIYGISYNTTHYGAAPIGEGALCYVSSGGCGYDSLNVGAASTTPSVGTDDAPNGVFQNASYGGSYCDLGTGGTGTFRLDTPCWTGFNPLVRFNAATPLGTTCLVADNGTDRQTLLGDCTTDHTLFVPNGYTFDGDGHTITAVDPSGGHFLGAILRNAGAMANVENVTLTTANLADACDAGADRLRGILFDGASGSITNNHVTNIEQGTNGESGCQEGNGIDIRTSGNVTISGNTVADYQKTGIIATESVTATITGNAVTGDGPIAYIAQNGIQVSYGATAKITNNTVTGNDYTPPKVTACGLLIYKAGGVSASKNGVSSLKADNAISGNETDICNFGKGGGFDPTA
jgi:parallel beta-helix repeat protein